MTNDQVTLYPGPDGEPASEDFTLTINGQSVFVYQARVSALPFNQLWPGYQRPLDQTELAAFAYWDMAGPVTVEVVSRRPVSSVSIRPSSRKITPAIRENTITFVLEKPGPLTVEINGYHYALHLFPNAPEEHAVDVHNPAVRYFGPGIHHPGKITLKSGELVYIAGGAVVHGAIEARDAQNIKVLGRGILDLSGYQRSSNYEDGKGVRGAFYCYHCDQVLIEGIIMREPPGWPTVFPAASRNILISNIKLIGLWKYSNDGIDIVNCQHVRIDKCFVRSFDDSIALKGLKGRGGDTTDDQNMEDILVTDCVVWNDWGRALELGAETCADSYNHITFRNCDVIRANYVALDIQHGDRALIENVRFENIRVEIDAHPMPALIQKDRNDQYPLKEDYGFCPRLLVVEIKKSGWNQDPTPGNVRNVTFKDIHVTTARPMPASEFSGYDEAHTVENVTVENLVINGQRMKSLEQAQCTVKPFARNVKVI